MVKLTANTIRKFIVLLLSLSMVIGAANIAPASAWASSYYKWLAQTTYQSCELGIITVNYTYGYSVIISSTASVNGPTNCGFGNFDAVPGSLTERQAIGLVNPNTGYRSECNAGVRIANDGYYTHAISTTWNVNPKDICGLPVCSWYYVEQFVYYLSAWTGKWVGGLWYTDNNALYLCPGQ